MNGASKILTVSYGTFSCTLEGFDEPFNTMKAIAEYFRDLAADDRYFGAEPPTPDAAMLHQIAEREIKRRVETRVQDNGVILRAEEDGTPRALPKTVKAAVAEVSPVARPTELAVSESVAAKLQRIRAAVAGSQTAARSEPFSAPYTDFIEDQHSEVMPTTFAAETFAPVDVHAAPEAIESEARLAKSPVSETPVPELAAVDMAQPEVPSHEDIASEEDEPISAPAGNVVADAADPVMDDLSDAADDDALLASLAGHSADDTLAAAEPIAEPVAEAKAEPTSEADDDLRSFMSALNSSPEPEAEAEAIDEPAPAAFDDDADEMFAEAAEPVAGFATEAEPQDAPTAYEDEDALVEDAAPLAISAEQALAAQDYAEQSHSEPVKHHIAEVHPADIDAPISFGADFATGEDDMLARSEADVAPVSEAQPLDDTDSTPVAMDEPTSDESLTEVDAPLDEDAATVPDAAEDAQPAVMEKLQRARARVIKIRRAAPAETAPEPTLSAQAEDDLARELADVRGDTQDKPASDDLTEDASIALEQALSDDETTEAKAEPQRTVTPSRPVIPGRPAARNTRLAENGGDEAVSRLIEQTNTEMQVPEQRRRLSAIAHLKAAVAATVADRLSGGKPKPTDAERSDPYRTDLTKVMGPATPLPPGAERGDDKPADSQPAETDMSDAAIASVASALATEQPRERPAPLVLVSAQRIDRPAVDASVAASAMLRPRRVGGSNLALKAQDDDEDDDDDASDDDNFFSDAKGFTEFADRLGAVELADLLEAAAAYTSTVEGRPHFSRPQLLRQVGSFDPDPIHSREDSLRVFGVLLRDGKIEKVKRGQYALTDASRYLDEARKLVG